MKTLLARVTGREIDEYRECADECRRILFWRGAWMRGGEMKIHDSTRNLCLYARTMPSSVDAGRGLHSARVDVHRARTAAK